MSYMENINFLQLDALREIGNIGSGHAATSLSKLLNKKIDMSVPNVQIVTFDEMMNMAGGTEKVAAGVFLRIEGDITGSMFFLLPIEQATQFIRDIIRDPSIDSNGLLYNDLALSVLQELGNILAGSYLSSLSDFTNLFLYPTVPSLAIDMVGAIISYGLIQHSQVSDFAIVINSFFKDSTNIRIEGVDSQFFLLPDPESFPVLFQALGVRADE